MAEPVPGHDSDNRARQSDAIGNVRSEQNNTRNKQETQRDYYSGDVLDVRCPFCRRSAQLLIRNGHVRWLIEAE